MLKKENALRKENSSWIFKCRECPAEVKSKDYYLSRHSGLCKSCCVRKKPFEHLFNKLKNSAKFEKHTFELTFEQFVQFTTKDKCHYCHAELKWTAYVYANSEYQTGAYQLDRKDNNKGYSTENSVECCSKCNISKGDRYTYEEWYGMTGYLRGNPAK